MDVFEVLKLERADIDALRDGGARVRIRSDIMGRPVLLTVYVGEVEIRIAARAGRFCWSVPSGDTGTCDSVFHAVRDARGTALARAS